MMPLRSARPRSTSTTSTPSWNRSRASQVWGCHSRPSATTGRNTTIIRANYGIPEAIRFYQHSLEMYQSLEDETGAEILHQTKGIFWVAHTEMAMRTERARALMNTACGAKTFMVTPVELKELVPQVDLTGGGRYPVLGASHHVEAATARHDRVAWAYAAGASQRGAGGFRTPPAPGLLADGYP